MKPFILAIATALPQYSLDQESLGKKVIDMFKLTDEPAQFIKKIYERTEIKRRYSVIKDIELPLEKGEFFTHDFIDNIPGTAKRNEIYIKEAPKLAKDAALSALKKWGGQSGDITHIISVSCTGVMAPGIEFILQKELALRDDVSRLGINFMGCFGAFKGLSVACALAKEDPSNRILLVCTELCSLHAQVAVEPEILIGNALFADGAAAVVVGCNPKDFEHGLWYIEKTGSLALKDSQEAMTWKVGDSGCIMTLQARVPKLIEQQAPNLGRLLGKENGVLKNNTGDLGNVHEKSSDYTWAIHPGGKAIIAAIERVYNLKKSQTNASWNVLANYGNMSSATFLFVLNELEKNIEEHKQVIGLGFGPGLSLESILLKRD